MKTFLGSFNTSKAYPFNTEGDIEIGDKLRVDGYSTRITVIAILDEPFKFFNYKTSELSNGDELLLGTGLIKEITFEKE